MRRSASRYRSPARVASDRLARERWGRLLTESSFSDYGPQTLGGSSCQTTSRKFWCASNGSRKSSARGTEDQSLRADRRGCHGLPQGPKRLLGRRQLRINETSPASCAATSSAPQGDPDPAVRLRVHLRPVQHLGPVALGGGFRSGAWAVSSLRALKSGADPSASGGTRRRSRHRRPLSSPLQSASSCR
jgi:hypothetical protein